MGDEQKRAFKRLGISTAFSRNSGEVEPRCNRPFHPEGCWVDGQMRRGWICGRVAKQRRHIIPNARCKRSRKVKLSGKTMY